jgi:hypothetical protein
MVSAILSKFTEIENNFHRWHDGDVVRIVGNPSPKGRDNHLGVYMGGIVYHFTMRLHRTAIRQVAANIVQAFRHKEMKGSGSHGN